MNDVTSNTRQKAAAPAVVSAAWPKFQAALAQVLERLAEDQYLVISYKDAHRFVQFAGEGAHGLRLETISNHYLEPSDQLDEQQLAALRALGWQDPTQPPPESTPKGDPDGSPNYFVDMAAPVDFAVAAELAVRTLVEVLGVSHPGLLVYNAFEREGASLVFAELKLKRAAEDSSEQAFEWTQRRMVNILQEVTHLDSLGVDEDGDVLVHYGNIAVFTRLTQDPLRVRIVSPLLLEAKVSSKLKTYLNEANRSGVWMRLFLDHGTVLALAELPASPLNAEHLSRVFVDFCRNGDQLAQSLQARFGAETIFSGDAHGVSVH
jgi:hypothetical protein